MRSWEYKIIDSSEVLGPFITFKKKDREALDDCLNELGRDGWEIVNMNYLDYEGMRSFVCLAKRPRATSPLHSGALSYDV